MITRHELSELLQNNVMKICFTKKDESDREMLCTLHKYWLPAVDDTQEKTNKSINKTLIPVWDIESNDWRSIIIDRIYHYEIVE